MSASQASGGAARAGGGARTHVLVVGAGPGGLAAAARLRQRGGEAVAVTLLSAAGRAVFHAGTLDVALGRAEPEQFTAQVRLEGVECLAATVDEVDGDGRGVRVDGRRLDADAVIAAPGLETAPIPPWPRAVAAWDPLAAARARAAMPQVAAGRVLVAACSLPYRCPPAPFALAIGLAGQHMSARHMTTVTVATPEALPLAAVGGEAPALVLDACSAAGVTVARGFSADLDASEDGLLRSADGQQLRYDAAFLIPPHRRARCLAHLPGSGPLVEVDEHGCVAGSMLYVVGDAAATALPRAAGVARAKAVIAADRVLERLGIAAVEAAEPVSASCFMFHYGGAVSRLRVSFPGPPGSDPVVEIDGPSLDLAAAREGERRRFLAAAGGETATGGETGAESEAGRQSAASGGSGIQQSAPREP
jgi:sulfide:quinone oxidoreductase